ncbi:MAG: DUF4345 family protein [Myxococcota bacterium]|nr:DUF4345 family protein [Myxococcota bacterium]
MELGPLLHNLGALATLGLGINGMLRPRATSRFVHMTPDGRMGLSEIRATYGGLFAAMGAFALLAQDEVAFSLLGAAWVGAAVGRVFSIVVDDAREPLNFGGVAFESAFALLLLAPL